MNPQIRRSAERPQRLLAIVAHPGDVDVAIAGSVAAWVAQGTIAQLVCCTSGDSSGDDASADPLALAATREAEQRAAAAIVGFDSVAFLHRPDGALANDLALREQLVRLIRSFRPDAVTAPDPRPLIVTCGERGRVNHIDHRAAGAAAIDAVSPAAHNAMAFPHLLSSERLQPHRVDRLYLFSTERPSAVVDISATLDTKSRAIAVHHNQTGGPDGLERCARERARDDGALVGIAAGEAYAVIDLE